ncbi:S24 family peptidase [Pantoea sp. YU22]|uniref:S24 family peptidase n=1 Tax=Pantoea sp. YU22 TaxID=2497684 RepID=UPI002682773B
MGFPSPAADYVEKRISLDQLCITKPSATYLFTSDCDAPAEGIKKGSLLVVESGVSAFHRAVIVSEVDGEFRLRRYLASPFPALQDLNAPEKVLRIDTGEAPESELCATWGVVRYAITPMGQ